MSDQKYDIGAGVESLRAFVPAKDFDLSEHFYTDLSFRPERLGNDLTAMHLGAFAFNLQRFYVKELADNFMMHCLVKDLQPFWTLIAAANLPETYGVPAPRGPELQPWGLIVAYVVDPSGVLWHFAQKP